MPTPDDLAGQVAALRASLIADAPTPATDEADMARVSEVALETIRAGKPQPRPTELRIRLAGKAIPGHDVPVASAAKILEAMQGAVTAVGSAVEKQKTVKSPRRPDGKRIGIRRATELRLNANISPGSVVFHLQGFAEDIGDPEDLTTGLSDTLVDVAISELFKVLRDAEEDSGDNLGHLTDRLRSHGAMVASKLKALAEVTSNSEVELDLGLWAASGARKQVYFRNRGAAAILEAVERNRERTEPAIEVIGTLNTVSDGVDKVRLTIDGGSPLLMDVSQEVGLTLGKLLGRRVVAEVETTITWKLATGRETSRHRLLAAAEA